MTTNHIPMLLALSEMQDPALKADELDKMWADFGRRVQYNLMHPDLLTALNRACLTCSNHIELATMVRAYLLTGTRS